MIEANILALLSTLGDPDAESHDDWVRGSCPLAFARHKSGEDRNPSFGVHINPTGKSGYSCFACQLHGKELAGLAYELTYYQKDGTFPEHYNLAKAFEIIEAENEVGYHGSDWAAQGKQASKLEIWPEWWLESFPSIFKFSEAVAYMNGRGIVPAVVKALDVRFDPHKGIIGFPIRTRTKKLAGMRGRYLNPVNGFKHYDYKWNGVSNTSLVLLGEDHIDPLKPVVVCEGQFDMAKIYRVYRNVVANLTASMSAGKIKKLKTAVEVIAFFDDDVAGVEAALTLKEHLKNDCAYRIVKYPSMPKDCEKQDPGGLSVDAIAKILKPLIHLDKRID